MDNNTNDDYEDFTSYSDYKAGVMIWKVIPPILIIFGTFGNILSIWVLTRRSIRSSTTGFYLTVLAFSDLAVLYTGLLRQWLNFLVEKDVRHVSEASCKIHMWLVYVSLDFSAWILMTVTLERVISAWCPHRAKSTCTRKSALVAMSSTLVFLLLLNSHMLYGMGDYVASDGHVSKCVELNDNYANFFNLTWPWIDLCVFCVLPLSVLMVGNICILVKVFASQKKARATIAPQLSGRNGRQTKQGGHKNSSMTAMLFTLNVVFLVSTSPVSVYNIGYPHWRDGTARTQARLDFWWAVVNMFMYFNNSMNFLLYCLSGSRFREEVKKLFSCKRRNMAEAMAMTNTRYTRTKFEPTKEPNQFEPTKEPNLTIPTADPVPSSSNIIQVQSVSSIA